MVGTLESQRAVVDQDPMRLSGGPLLRAVLVRSAPTEAHLVLIVHQLIADGWSVGVLIEDLARSYRHAISGAGDDSLVALPQVSDYLQFLSQALPPQHAADLAYWRAQMQQDVPVLSQPTDHLRPAIRSLSSARVDRALEAGLLAALKAAAARSGVGLFSLLCGVHAGLLARLGGVSSLRLAVPAAAQTGEGLDRLVGQATVHLPLRIEVDVCAPAATLLQAVQTALLDGMEHASVGQEHLQDEDLPDASVAMPVTRVRFAANPSAMTPATEFPGLARQLTTLPRSADLFELSLQVDYGAEGLALACQFDTQLFDAATVDRWLALYEAALRRLVQHPAATVGDLYGPNDDELALLARFNATAAPFAEDRLIHAQFEEQARLQPDAVAVEFLDDRLSFDELNRQANRIAHHLIALGVRPDDRVAICFERSVALVVSLLGVMKAGAAYVPLDPDYPVDRVRHVLADSAPVALLTQQREIASVGSALAWQGPTLRLDALGRCAELDTLSDVNPDSAALGLNARHLAYVIYTSGSTGTPKGVMIEHRSVLNLWASLAARVFTADCPRVGVNASVQFDASVKCLIQLLSGRTLVMIPAALRVDPQRLLAFLAERRVDIVDCTPAQLELMVSAGLLNSDVVWPRALVIGGEAIAPATWQRLQAAQHRRFINVYGPTECTVDATFACLEASGPMPTIGAPIQNAQVHILDPQGRPVPIGVAGELFIGGAGVARGYLNRADLSAERFVPDPFSNRTGARLYKTGDLGRWCADGSVDYLGRNDFQVKVRGFRIELGEIEARLRAIPAVRDCAVLASPGPSGENRLVAYVVPAAPALSKAELRARLAAELPDYMVPNAYVVLAALPLTPNGKLDRRALPEPSQERPELAEPYQAPTSPLEAQICAAFGEVLGLKQVGALDNFFELGGSSLLVLRVLLLLQSQGLTQLDVAVIFNAPTPRHIAASLASPGEGAASRRQLSQAGRQPGGAGIAVDDPIAIVGMAGRFPGANSLEALWSVLSEGRDTVRFFKPEEIDASVPAELRADPNYVAARGVVDGFDLFDAAFFGINPREAELMDPQQRIFLELCWECLERAGHVPRQYDAPIGVFAGSSHATYLRHHVLAHPDKIRRIGEFQVTLANEKDYIATRVAHKLDLTGPAVSLNTACSTSLVAVVQAVQSLWFGQCRMALAGGSSISCPPNRGYVHEEGAMLSPDGHTRAFDANAGGTVFSDGAAVLLLKRLSDAVADGNPIYAVIRGAAINNDGGDKASFTAPSVDGQAAVIAAAIDMAGVDARSIGYVEAHGTGTPLGDPIEVAALTKTYRRHTADSGYCRIGSVKSHFGHVVAAAGATGLIKAALSLHKNVLPGTVHFQAPNPKIDFAASPFAVQARTEPWPRSAVPRRAGVSSFGVGGTNAHVVIEEAPLLPPSTPAEGPQLLLLSARSRAALDVMALELADHLTTRSATPEAINLADVAHTLQVGRSRFTHRLSVVAEDLAQAAEALRGAGSPRRAQRALGSKTAPLVWVFPGQGAQYVGMGRHLYATEPAFRAAFDECAQALDGVLPFDLRERVFAGDAESLMATEVTQPATFSLEYALARWWEALGVRPAALIGHSVGEFVAAVLAGVMDVADAARLVARRGALMQALPPGQMLSVRLGAAELTPRLPADVSLAAHNGPTACVVAGPQAAIDRFAAALEGEGIVTRALQTSHAFHSSMMDGAVQPFEAQVRAVRLRVPSQPIISTLTGTWMTPAEATDPGYWARHLRACVRFSPAVQTALSELSGAAFLEIGPRGTLSTLVRQHGKAGSAPVAVATLEDRVEVESQAVLAARGQLWTLGIEPDAGVARPAQGRRRLCLPTYAFERKRFWVDTAAEGARLANSASAAPAVTVQAAPAPASALLSARAPEVSHPLSVAPAAAGISHSLLTPESTMSTSPSTPAPVNRRATLIPQLHELFEDVSGTDFTGADPAISFVELGLDSLTLTQAAMALKKAFAVNVSFRQLMETLRSFDALADHLDKNLPAAVAPAPVAPVAAATVPVPAQVSAAAGSASAPIQTPAMQPVWTPAATFSAAVPAADATALQQLIAQQMQLMAQQLALLGGAVPAAIAAPVSVAAAAVAAPASVQPIVPAATTAAAAGADDEAKPIKYDVKTAFGAIARIHTQSTELTDRKRSRLDAFLRRYVEKTAKSKAYTAEHRAHLADPRVVHGFRPATKEISYQLVVERSKGSRMWDIDGNEYVDALNGFGMCMFGWQPDFVQAAVRDQLEKGYDIGPQHPLAGEVAKLICELTGFDRAGLCNTGSEAVMGAIRVARTVTGRSTIVVFTGCYHGIFDEVLVRAGRNARGIPAAPGIMPGAFGDVKVLDYGTPEAVEYIRQHGADIAAVVVEPVQSRRADFQPKEFHRDLRAATEQAGVCLIFDEVITGFRCHPGGAQALFGVKADLATYGKVIGGGFPIGVIAGKREYMDALDGGDWRYGDDSMPSVGVTYFAGTFVRHPLALAAAKASLQHMKDAGPELQAQLNLTTAALADELNAFCREVGAPVTIKYFSSLWRITWLEDHPFQDLLFAMMRNRGVHVLDNFPCFMTTAHTPEDIAKIKQAFKESVLELVEGGFLPGQTPTVVVDSFDASKPPVPNAKLGRDKEGRAAWFVPDPNAKGKYVKLGG